MVLPLIRRMQRDGFISEAHWVSLNQSGPETIEAGGITLHSVTLDKDRLKSYGVVKETIWRTAHGDQTDAFTAKDIFWGDDYPEFAFYNRLTAELIRELDKKHDFDIFYIHDFQQLPIGQMLGTLKPKIYRWHIPFDKSMIPAQWTEPLSTYFGSYDVVVVSTSKYLESLKSFGYTGRVRKVYPYIDPDDYSLPPQEEVIAVSNRLGIAECDDVILIVARMDPFKGHDRALRALSSIASRYPHLKLVLIGNGSFSSSKQGLGISKAERWRGELEALSSKLGIRDRVVFAGHLAQRDLDAMYERCKFTILPSINEGFGLVVVESWLHRKATLVTERAGVTELIKEGKNGLVIDPDDTAGVADKMSLLLDDDELARRIGEDGYEISKYCLIDEGERAETEVIRQLVGE